MVSIKKDFSQFQGFWSQIRIHIADVNPDPDSGESSQFGSMLIRNRIRNTGLDMTVHDMKNLPVWSPDHLHSCPWI
jgi:hypothetical protein